MFHFFGHVQGEKLKGQKCRGLTDGHNRNVRFRHLVKEGYDLITPTVRAVLLRKSLNFSAMPF